MLAYFRDPDQSAPPDILINGSILIVTQLGSAQCLGTYDSKEHS